MLVADKKSMETTIETNESVGEVDNKMDTIDLTVEKKSDVVEKVSELIVIVDDQPKQEAENGDEKPSTSTVAPVVIKKKRKKGRKIKRSENYPKFYRNAYVRYCEEARPKASEENPTLSTVEITKLVAANWLSLDQEIKKPFLDEAQLDKDRYDKELKEYQKLNKSDEPPKKKSKKNHQANEPLPSVVASQNLPSTSTAAVFVAPPLIAAASSSRDEIPKAFLTSNCELPIFTDAFLEHNKIIEAELKTLRKNNIEIEQQNSVLMKHIENMENGVRKVEAEIGENRLRNCQLEVYLIKLRVKLSAHFHSHSQPGWNGATVENVDKYFQDLASEANKHPTPVPAFISKARDIIKKVDLKIH